MEIFYKVPNSEVVVTVASRDYALLFLETVLMYLMDVHDAMENGACLLIYTKFRTFKYIYNLYFFINILHVSSILSPIV